MPEIKYCAICGEPSQTSPCAKCLQDAEDARKRHEEESKSNKK